MSKRQIYYKSQRQYLIKNRLSTILFLDFKN